MKNLILLSLLISIIQAFSIDGGEFRKAIKDADILKVQTILSNTDEAFFESEEYGEIAIYSLECLLETAIRINGGVIKNKIHKKNFKYPLIGFASIVLPPLIGLSVDNLLQSTKGMSAQVGITVGIVNLIAVLAATTVLAIKNSQREKNNFAKRKQIFAAIIKNCISTAKEKIKATIQQIIHPKESAKTSINTPLSSADIIIAAVAIAVESSIDSCETTPSYVYTISINNDKIYTISSEKFTEFIYPIFTKIAKSI